jgi:Transposase domain (DUF772)
MIRMLLIDYLNGVRSERRLCSEVHLNIAYRWFCRLGLDGTVPDHSTFSKNRHGRFRESDLFRRVFEQAVHACMKAGLSGVTSVPTNSLNPKLTPAVTEPSLNAELGCIKVVDTFRGLDVRLLVSHGPTSRNGFRRGRRIRRSGHTSPDPLRVGH